MLAMRAAGLVALLVAVTIWAGWFVVVRDAVLRADGLGPLDLALTRFGVPALLLAPVWLRCGPWPAAVTAPQLAIMVAGWGAPFVVMAAHGLRSSDAAIYAALVPGSMPLWLWLIDMARSRRRPGRQARLGLWLIALGALGALVAAIDAGRSLDGAPWFVAASVGWAVYALALRETGLTPLQATAVVALWSTLLLVPALMLWPPTLPSMPLHVVIEQVLIQGILAGIVAVAAFVYAIRTLGATRAATGVALVPVLGALGGHLVLGDPLGWGVVAGLCATVAGVALVNAAPLSQAGRAASD